MYFETKAHVDEYVIDSEETATFAASDGELTYTRPGADDAVSIPVSEAKSVEFGRNTSLRRHASLGLFFLLLSLVLTVGTGVLVYQGWIGTPTEIALVGFLSLFAVGGWNATYEFLSHSERDVIDVYIATDAETHVLCGEIRDAEFVGACEALIESEIPTTNRNPRLEAELD